MNNYIAPNPPIKNESNENVPFNTINKDYISNPLTIKDNDNKESVNLSIFYNKLKKLVNDNIYKTSGNHTKIPNDKDNNYIMLGNDAKTKYFKTLNDFEELKINEIFDGDSRTSREFFWHMLITRHNFFFTFFRFSIFNPMVLRLTKYILFISLNFSLNAVLFSDTYIEEKSANQLNSNLLVVKNDFLYSLIKLFWKSVLSAILCWIPLILLNLLTDIPGSIKYKIFLKVHTRNSEEIKEIYSEYMKRMRIQFVIFFFLAFSLIILSWYYTIVFCAIYRYSSIVWFYGGVISIACDFIFQIFKFTIILVVRKIFLSYPQAK